MRKLMIVFMIAIVASQAPPIQAEPYALDIHYQLYAQFSPFVNAVLIKNRGLKSIKKEQGNRIRF